ncbi:hypothetical protein R1sor_023450 [Riccia sorocarpa]|uniref:BAG domain-containing protein n=1 Tax=Riccia sorocarpa TaxID=122646 RepID=A0ABD3GTP1_9MARC
MGGGMAFGEPYEYGFRYPYGAMGRPGYGSGYAPRRPSRFWVDESFPEEGTNLARKRKLDGVKGEPLSNGKNVREIFVDGPSAGATPRSRELEAESNVSTKSRSSSSASLASPSSSLLNENRSTGESPTVRIPVTFNSEPAKEQPVRVVLPEGIKKPKRALNVETAAALIQSAYRGYALRRTKPLQHMRRISEIRTKLKEIERRLSDDDTVREMRTDTNVRLQITEGIMALLLQLDSIQGVHADVRVWRKAVTREVVMLEERVDALLNGEGPSVEKEVVSVESSFPSRDGNAAMTAEGDSAGVCDGDEDMSDIAPKEFPPETVDPVEEIVLHQLKLEDDEGRPPTDEVISEEGKSNYVCEHDDKGVVFLNPECLQAASVIEPIRQCVDKLKGEDVVSSPNLKIDQASNLDEQVGHSDVGLEASKLGSGVPQQSGDLTSADQLDSCVLPSTDEVGLMEIAECKAPTTADESQLSAEPLGASGDNVQPEAIENLGTRAAIVGEGETALFERHDSAPLGTGDMTEIAEHGQRMELDGESPREPDGGECARDLGGFECCLRSDPQEQERLKHFLEEISSPSSLRLMEAEETGSLAPSGLSGMFSEREEDDDRVATSEQQSTQGAHCKEEATCEPAEKLDKDQLLLKLSEENKMLKSLLLDVMKWNQLQANNMKNVTERLGKLEDKLMKKSNSGKPRAQRCSRSRLERKLRR